MGNAQMTAYGVVYDVANSPFCVYRNGCEFFFSSAKHMEKFKEQAPLKEDWLCDSLSRRFKIAVDSRVIADFQLYQQIEKRGFYVRDVFEGGEFSCPQDVLLDGCRPRSSGLGMQSEPTMPR